MLGPNSGLPPTFYVTTVLSYTSAGTTVSHDEVLCCKGLLEVSVVRKQTLGLFRLPHTIPDNQILRSYSKVRDGE